MQYTFVVDCNILYYIISYNIPHYNIIYLAAVVQPDAREPLRDLPVRPRGVGHVSVISVSSIHVINVVNQFIYVNLEELTMQVL